MNSPEPSSNSRSRRKVIGGVIALVLLGSAAGAMLYLRASDAKTAADSKKAETPVTLEFTNTDVVQVELKSLARTITISGSLNPVIQSMVRSTVAGEILKLAVREGDAVRQGEVIAEIATTDLRSRLEAALADQEERRARLSVALNNRNTNQALLKQNFISKNAYDQTQGTYEAAEAAVRWADAQVSVARKALADAVVRAPISGRIAKRMVNAGERVSPETPLVSIVDLARLELEVTVPASEVPEIRLGQRVDFKVDGFGTRRFEGRVDRINPVTETATRAIKLFIAVPNADSSLKGGMFAEGAVTLAQSTPAPVVPISAVFEEAGQSYVFAIQAGKLAKVPITIDTRDETTGLASIGKGLQPGTQVVRTRIGGLKAGLPAVFKPAATANPA